MWGVGQQSRACRHGTGPKPTSLPTPHQGSTAREGRRREERRGEERRGERVVGPTCSAAEWSEGISGGQLHPVTNLITDEDGIRAQALPTVHPLEPLIQDSLDLR